MKELCPRSYLLIFQFSFDDERERAVGQLRKPTKKHHVVRPQTQLMTNNSISQSEGIPSHNRMYTRFGHPFLSFSSPPCLALSLDFVGFILRQNNTQLDFVSKHTGLAAHQARSVVCTSSLLLLENRHITIRWSFPNSANCCQ